MSLRYIAGSTVDYVTTGMGGGFKVENPNSTGGCGCGSSFQTDEAGGAAGLRRRLRLLRLPLSLAILFSVPANIFAGTLCFVPPAIYAQ